MGAENRQNTRVGHMAKALEKSSEALEHATYFYASWACCLGMMYRKMAHSCNTFVIGQGKDAPSWLMYANTAAPAYWHV